LATPAHKQPVLFFDGVCNLCNGLVQFVIRHDKKKQFLFASLQSAAGAAALDGLKKQSGEVPDSVILFYKGKYYARSSAAIMLARLLRGPWQLLSAGYIIPRFIRDAAYNFIARNRYKWFGRQEACWLPAPELKERFL
jgi:predicted DCC family thiol-disulfide oxidoreductase YuxK